MKGRVDGVHLEAVGVVRVAAAGAVTGGAAGSVRGSDLYCSCLGMLLRTRYAAGKTCQS